jgi:hypothetical protein
MVLVSDLVAHLVDPRDCRWEVWTPAYRVYFWRLIGDAFSSREFQISNADITMVLEWANLQSNDNETYTVFAVVDRGNGLGLVRLAGDDPTRSDPS